MEQLLSIVWPQATEDVIENKSDRCKNTSTRGVEFCAVSRQHPVASWPVLLTMEEVGLARAVCTNCETKRMLEQNVALRTSSALFYIPTVLILSLKGSATVWSL